MTIDSHLMYFTWSRFCFFFPSRYRSFSGIRFTRCTVSEKLRNWLHSVVSFCVCVCAKHTFPVVRWWDEQSDDEKTSRIPIEIEFNGVISWNNCPVNFVINNCILPSPFSNCISLIWMYMHSGTVSCNYIELLQLNRAMELENLKPLWMPSETGLFISQLWTEKKSLA